MSVEAFPAKQYRGLYVTAPAWRSAAEIPHSTGPGNKFSGI